MRAPLCISVFAVWIVQASAYRPVYFINVPSVFGDQNDGDTQRYYSEACRNCSLANTGMFYSHENACNMYIHCIPFGPSWLVFGYVAPPGAVFNERRLHLDTMFEGDGTEPNRGSCPRVGHPCDTGKRIPVDNDGCHGYQECVHNRMVRRRCSNRFRGFNAKTQNCDLPCSRRIRMLISQRCEPNPTSDDYYYNYQTVRYSDEPWNKVEFFNLRCTLGYKYLDKTKCVCQPFNATRKPCETKYVVHLDSADDSWRMARKNTPLMKASSLNGNGIIVSNFNTKFRYAAQFMENRAFTAPMVLGNDLGLYFDMNCTFHSYQDNQVVPGLIFHDGFGRPNRDIAIADNSACDIPASYGCKLQARTESTGRVLCYVNPKMETNHPYNVVVASPDLDLRQKIGVYFAKDNTKGVLVVTEGRSERRQTFTFPTGVRAVGNACPLSIGAGGRKRNFNGYMYNLNIKKYCRSFL